MTRLPELTKKNVDPKKTVEPALQDESILQALLDGIAPEAKKTAVRENCSKTLLLLGEEHPASLLPHWAYFVGLLKSDNGFSKYVALHVIANLAQIDEEGRFAKAFNAYYRLLDDASVMVAAHVAGVSGAIAAAQPGLQSRITKRLLEIDKTHFDEGRKDLIKAYAIEAFDAYFERSRDRAKILTFVSGQLNASSPKTRKLAKAFLKKWEET